MAALSQPGFDLDFLAWISLVPLLLALESVEQSSLRRSFSLGLVAGLFYWGSLLYWIFALYEWAGLLILPAYLLLIAYLSLYWGIFGALYTLLRRRLGTIVMLFVTPALWIVLEFIKAQGPLGFTWGDLAYGLYRRPELIQVASISGVWGISFVIVLINSLLAVGVHRALEARRWCPALPYSVTAVVVLALLWGMNTLLSGGAERTDSDIRVAVIQSEVSQRQKRDPAFVTDLLAEYQRLLSGIDRQVNLVVLPESIMLAGLPLQQRGLLEPFTAFARDRVLAFFTTRAELGV